MTTTRRPAAKKAAAKRTTARKTPLAAVPDVPADETPVEPEPAKPMTVTEAAESGTQRDLLVALRRRIAQTVNDPKCPPRDLASLSRRLEILAEQIAALDLREKEEGGGSESVPDDDTYGAASI